MASLTAGRGRNGRFWLVVERTGDEIHNLLPEVLVNWRHHDSVTGVTLLP